MITIKKQQKIEELNLDGYKHIKNNNWELPENLFKWLTEKNFNLLGMGAFSLVFQSETEDFIVKINKGKIDHGYLDFINFCHQNKGNPHLPKMGKIKKYDNWYIIFIEKLEVIRNDIENNLFLKRLFRIILSSDIYDSNDLNDKDMFFKITKRLLKQNTVPEFFSDKEKKQQLLEIVYILYKFKIEYNIADKQFDVHFGNIMMRENTIVITDPVT